MSSSQDIPDRDRAIHALGVAIVADARVSAQPWARYALVAQVDDRRAQLNGFAYDDTGAARPATPGGTGVQDKVQALRAATRVPGKDPWGACVVRIERATQKITVEFEYDHPEKWTVTPQTAERIAVQAIRETQRNDP